MPLFRKQSEQAKRKLQHQLYLARENPEPIFNISECELSDIPQGVYSLCRVLQKKELRAKGNWLTSLSGGGKFEDLAGLKILDLSNNDLCQLPEDLHHCSHLEMLNLANNKMRNLPKAIGHLKALQILNCHSNKLTELPCGITNLKCLTYLDISSNHVTRLPQELCHIRTLAEIHLDSAQMKYPTKEICSNGTEAIMKFLCSECNIPYISPSDVVPPISTSNASTPSSPNKPFPVIDITSAGSNILQYEELKERKRKDRLALEKQFADEKDMQTELARKASLSKRDALNSITKEHERLQDELARLQIQRDGERSNRVKSLAQAEKDAAVLLSQLMEYNERNKKTEALLEQLEKERIEMERWFDVSQEEFQNLRRRDIIINMQDVINQNTQLQDKIQTYLRSKTDLARPDDSDKVSVIFAHKQKSQELLIQELLKEETYQKEAFEALLVGKDARHQRIRGEIDLIESELAQLSQLEMAQRNRRAEVNLNVLGERRVALAMLLAQLLEEKDKRESELRQRLEELEEKRLRDQTDYWLVQYQRLLDMKPAAMIDMESRLEKSVKYILEKAKAAVYIPTFARHRISIETLCQMTDKDLAQVGVHEVGLRKNILLEVEKFLIDQDEDKSWRKQKELQNQDDKSKTPPAASAPSTPVEAGGIPSAPSVSEVFDNSDLDGVTARINNECVVCMERQSKSLFLNCGHLCCCVECAAPLILCPLCRATIVHKITCLTT